MRAGKNSSFKVQKKIFFCVMNQPNWLNHFMHVLRHVLHILYEFHSNSWRKSISPFSASLSISMQCNVCVGFSFCGQNVLFAQWHFCVAGQFIIIISHELGLDIPVSALSISLFKVLPVCNGKCVPSRNELQEQLFMPQRTHVMLSFGFD